MENQNEALKTSESSLELLAANEQAIEALYMEYARQQPEKAAFWLDIANDEHRHSALIEEYEATLHDDVAPGRRFTSEAIRTFTGYVREQTAAARLSHVGFETALRLAYYIETALIERRYFEQLPLEGTDRGALMSVLQRETESHIKKIADARDTLTRH